MRGFRLATKGVSAQPVERFVDLSTGRFHLLHWPGGGFPILFLHGLTAVAEVWGPTIDELGANRPDCYAMDQRGHGDSHPSGGGYGISAYVKDTVEMLDALDLESAHIVGHSMGARVALVLAARHPERVRSVAILDIGPEQWRQNWVNSWTAFDGMPDRFENEQAALAFAGSRTQSSPIGTGVFLARLKPAGKGLTWRANREALKASVKSHRSRNFWKEWAAIDRPALLIRGGTSYELPPHIFKKMAELNPRVNVREFPDVSHNIPLIAPAKLAGELHRFWAEVA